MDDTSESVLHGDTLTATGKLVNLLRNDETARLVVLCQDTKYYKNVNKKRGIDYRMYHYYSTPGEESTFDCPEDVEKNIENLINELKVEGKVMLACAWTTLDESRRFKIHPWVCMMWM